MIMSTTKVNLYRFENGSTGFVSFVRTIDAVIEGPVSVQVPVMDGCTTRCMQSQVVYFLTLCNRQYMLYDEKDTPVGYGHDRDRDGNWKVSVSSDVELPGDKTEVRALIEKLTPAQCNLIVNMFKTGAKRAR